MSGFGTDIVRVSLPDAWDNVVLVTSTVAGDDYCSIASLDSAGNQIDLLVNAIGDFKGKKPSGLFGDAISAIQTTGSSRWSVEFRPLQAAGELQMVARGTGEEVLWYLGPLRIAEIRHRGDNYFSVWSYSENGSDLVVNEVGPFSGRVRFQPGPAVIAIESEGPWEIELSEF